jgi:hypothetical protein
MLQALLKYIPSRHEDSQAFSRIEQMEEGHTRLELVFVAGEVGRKIAQERVKHFLSTLSLVIHVPIRATRVPLNFMRNGSHLFKTSECWIEMIAVEGLSQHPCDLSLEFIPMIGTGTE